MMKTEKANQAYKLDPSYEETQKQENTSINRHTTNSINLNDLDQDEWFKKLKTYSTVYYSVVKRDCKIKT